MRKKSTIPTICVLLLSVSLAILALNAAVFPSARPVHYGATQEYLLGYTADNTQMMAQGTGVATFPTARPTHYGATQEYLLGYIADNTQDIANNTARIFRPETYGAVANDTTDDRAAIQSAIDAAYNAGGGIVMLGAGTYYVNEWGSGKGLFTKTGVILKGQGLRATTITTNPRLAATFYCVVAPFGYDTATAPYSAHEMRIEDICFTSTSYANSALMAGNSATYNSGAETLLTVSTSGDVIVGDTVVISSSGDASYNATWTVTAVPSSTTLAINKTWSAATSTGSLAFTKQQMLNDLLGIAHCPRARILRCGFDKAVTHYGEINGSKDVLIEDCRTIGTGNCGGSCWELDDLGACGIISSNARYSTTITGAATYTSGSQTLLTVSSTANFTAGSWVIISGANGASASSYNAVGGFKITGIVSSTTMAINLAYPGAATTAGTIKQGIPVRDVTIRRFNQSLGRTDKGIDPYGGYDFLHLSHTTNTGIFNNITVEDCVIMPHDSTAPISVSRIVLGFDNAAPPLEYSGLYIRRNKFLGGGQSSVSDIIYLLNQTSTTYARQMQDIVVEGNTLEDAGIYRFLQIGDKSAGSDSSVRTAVTAAQVSVWKNITIRDNVIQPIFRTGGSSFSRTSKGFSIGACERATITGNRVLWPNRIPIANPTSFTVGSPNIGFILDHPRDLWFTNNEVECQAFETNIALYCYPFVFGCSAYEIASGDTYKGSWVFENNAAIGTGAINAGIANGFVELLTAGTTGVSSWVSSTSPNIKGRWTGNRVITGGVYPSHTVGGSKSLAIPNNGSLTTAAQAPAFAEAPSGTNPGRHRWGYGPRYGTATLVAGTVTIADVLITANSNIQVTRSTAGGTTGHYQITRNVGQDFTITSSSGTDTSVVSYLITEPN